ncbi:MAG: hypothetical protein GY757_39720 [bacterium]|nr:hypothetical protein [bacterium]
MKKNLILVIFIIATFMLTSLPAMASSADDYKVIKKAFKGKKGGNVQWFKLSVYDKKLKKTTVKITLPLAIIDLLEGCKGDIVDLKDKCDVDLKQIVKALKQHGPMTLVEVDEEDSLVKIWFE